MTEQKESIDSVEFYFNPPKILSRRYKEYLEKYDMESLSFIESISELTCTKKAESYMKKYLSVIRGNIESTHPYLTVSDLEAFSYLKSRDIECDREVELAFQYLEGEQLDQLYFAGIGFETIKNSSIEEAETSKPLSTPLENFWRSDENDIAKYIEDAYYLRFIDLCKIEDFKEIWIERLKKEYSLLSVAKKTPSDLLKIILFNHCRSDYSLELFRENLKKLLELLESHFFTTEGDILAYKNDIIDFQAVAIIAFANIRLKNVKPKLLRICLNILINNQNSDGGWLENDKEKNSDLLTSVIVIHSLALAQEPLWVVTIKPCIDWIKSEQNVFGMWKSKVIDNIPFSVIILDALELANGSTKVTFSMDKPIVPYQTAEIIDTKVEKYPLNKFFPNINSKELHWTDIGLDFCSADKIEIKIGKVKKKISIEEFGLNKAHNSWKLLFTISSNNGFIDYPTLFKILDTKSKDAIQQNISRLRKKLSNYFGINEKPISYNSIQRCYQTEFLYFRNAYQKKAEELRTSDKVYFNPKFKILDENKDDFDELDENIDF